MNAEKIRRYGFGVNQRFKTIVKSAEISVKLILSLADERRKDMQKAEIVESAKIGGLKQ